MAAASVDTKEEITEVQTMAATSGDTEVDITRVQEFRSQDAFLCEIHSRFLNLVRPQESMLLDRLSENVLDSDTEQEILAETTTKNKNRKLWLILHRISPEDFGTYCYPILKDLYPHVLEGARYINDTKVDEVEECVRHIIMRRMKLLRFADLFIAAKGCTLQQYIKLTEGFADETKWELAFTLCAVNKHNDIFIQQLQNNLRSIKLRNRQVERHSKKRQKGPDLIKIPQTQIHKACPLSSGYPSTHHTSTDGENHSSISSDESSEAVMKEGVEDSPFDTKEQKGAFLQELGRLNVAINKASNIRTVSRKLAGIHEEINILSELAQSESMLSYEDRGKIMRLKIEGRNIYNTMKTVFQEVEKITQIAEDTDLPFNFELPFTKRKILLQKKHMLLNEMKEARKFFKQAVSLFDSSPFFCQAADDVKFMHNRNDKNFRIY